MLGKLKTYNAQLSHGENTVITHNEVFPTIEEHYYSTRPNIYSPERGLE